MVCEYVQKYMAREGATPTRFGPRPLNNALGPSFCTMCLKGNNTNYLTFKINKTYNKILTYDQNITVTEFFHNVPQNFK